MINSFHHCPRRGEARPTCSYVFAHQASCFYSVLSCRNKVTDVFQLVKCQLTSVVRPQSARQSQYRCTHCNNLVYDTSIHTSMMSTRGGVRVSFKTSALRHFRRRHEVLQVGVQTHPYVLCFDVSCFTDDTISKGFTLLTCYLVINRLIYGSESHGFVTQTTTILTTEKIMCQIDIDRRAFRHLQRSMGV